MATPRAACILDLDLQIRRMGLFSARLVDDAVAEWQFEGFEYLIDNFSSGPGLLDGDLWLPIAEHFGHPDGFTLSGSELAEFTYERILEQCQVRGDFPVDLILAESAPTGFVGTSAILHNDDKTACGLYQVSEIAPGLYKEAITIDFELTETPTSLIATLAHELSHALHNRAIEPYNGDPELYELFTDLSAVYFGYGIFLANSRFEFESNAIGWQARGAGYLPEADLIFATALFMTIKDIPASAAKPYLKPRLRKLLGKAFQQLSRYSADIEALRERVPANLSQPA